MHKLNGVKIAVSVAKMAVEDLEYVERVTGKSLDDDKPLSEIRRRSLQAAGKDERKKPLPSASASKPPTSKPGAVVEQPKSEPKMPDYDWFDFFLKAGVNLHQCERYAFNFNRDSMDETVLPDITPEVLRTLGLKEGDILRVMKYLDSKYGRTGAKSKLRNVSFGGEEVIKGDEEPNSTTSPNSTGGGLFSGPGGALRNNTRKGRPAPTVQNDDVVDAKTFKQRSATEKKEERPEPTALASVPLPEKKTTSGFDDDAWDVKPSKQTPPVAQPGSSAPAVPSTPSQPPLTGALADLSLLSAPLHPIVVHSGAQQPQHLQPQPQEPTQAVQQTQQTQPIGANQSSFSRLPQQSTGPQPQLAQAPPASNFTSQQTFPGQQPHQSQAPRQRPQAPQATQQGSLILPPPPRPLSAPQNVSQPNSFGPPPLQPQLTGAQNLNNFQNRIALPGQSLNDIDQLRVQQLQQQYGQQQMYPQPTGLASNQNPGFGQFGNGIPIQQTGYGQQFQAPPSFSNPQSFLAAQQTGSPFADSRLQQQQQLGNFQHPLPPQTTGYPPQPHPQPTMQPGSINSMLPPPLQPQLTGAPNGFASGPINGYSGGRPPFGQPPPPIPSSSPFQSQTQPQPPTMAPLQPQKTGPAPPIRFGVTAESKKLVPQPTGRRANLSHASKLFPSRMQNGWWE